MQKCEGSVFWRECLWIFKCDVRHNSCLYKKKQMKRRSEVEDASSRKSKSRTPFSKANTPFSKEPFPFSKVGLGALRKPRAEPGFEPRFSKDQLFQFVVTRHMHRQLCGNYGALCQKARNGYCSSIHRLPTEVRE